ncbi:MAG: Nif3-like dinuclear metal center hexameric protein [Candidatus Hodarchaeota archaeon]
MKAIEIFSHLKEKGTWVNWNRTCDEFLCGDPETEVKGVAVAWMTSFSNLKKAHELGCNLFITHEALYAGFGNEYGVYSAHNVLLEEDDPWVEKGKWLEEKGMVVFRCHDVWDDFPEIGIHGAWAKFLGFTGKPAKLVKFYEVHEVEARLFGDIVNQVLEHVKDIGQEAVLYMGDLDDEVSSVAFGTGAITNYRVMHQLGADVLILTDDGMNFCEVCHWAEDTGNKLIIVNHATAEEPGMRQLAGYLQKEFPSVPVKAIERGCLYKVKC